MKQNVISDSSPLIGFIKKNELSVLHKLFPLILITGGVYTEIIEGKGASEEQKQQLKTALDNGWLEIRKITPEQNWNFPLGLGENETISLACVLSDPLILMDEKKGRKIARTNNLSVLGTIGIITLAMTKKIINVREGKKNLKILLETGFYLAGDAIYAFLNHAEDLDRS
jgi:predicted nucleic acid-binding protein